MKLGFVGTGAITSAMVTGLCAEGGTEFSIRLSPRNAKTAAELAERFGQVSVAESNQQVLDDSDVVVLAVRPQVAQEVISELRFRPEHEVVTLVAGFRVERMRGMVAPAARVTRAVPLPMSARRRCPTAMYPRDEMAIRLFGALGAAFAVETEHALEAFSTATSTMAAYFSFADAISGWLVKEGIPQEQAREYTARIFAGMSATAVEAPEHTFEVLAKDHATPGGLNEQVVKNLRAHGVFETLRESLDAVMGRVQKGF